MITRYATIDDRLADYIKSKTTLLLCTAPDSFLCILACNAWLEYASGTLKETNELDNTLIGGFNPREYTAMLPGDQYMVRIRFEFAEEHQFL